jgi:hypothetical protein
LVVRRAGVTSHANVTSRTIACAARHKGSGYGSGIAVAVEAIRTRNRSTRRVALVVDRAGVAGGPGITRCAGAYAYRRECASDGNRITVTVCAHSARNRCASRVSLITYGTSVTRCPAVASRAVAGAPRHKRSGDRRGIAVAVGAVAARNRCA